MTDRTYRDEMNEGMTKVARVIEHVWGPRCSIHDAHCPTCHHWSVFDYMMRSLDTALLEEEHPTPTRSVRKEDG